MPRPIPDNPTDDDRQSAEQAAVAQLLRNFFVEEVPWEIRELVQEPTATPRASQKSRRRPRLPLLAALGLAIGLIALLGWWKSVDDRPGPTTRIATIPKNPAPEPRRGDHPRPVIAPRPLDPFASRPFAPQLTSHIEPWSHNRNVMVQWTHVQLIEPASATQLVFEIPTELRMSHNSTAAAYRPAGRRQFVSTKTILTSHLSPLTSQLDPVRAPRPMIGRRNYLGVFTATPGPLSKTQPFAPLGGIHGLEILDLLPNSPATAAGLHAGDILIAFNGEPLDTATRLSALIARQNPGETIRLDIAGPRGFRTVEAVIGNRVFATSRSSSRTWRLPDDATLRGRETFSLSTAGWPMFSPASDDAQAGTALRLSPAKENYALRRLSSNNGQSLEKMIWRGNPQELNVQDVPDDSRQLCESLRDAWTNLTAISPDNSPLCRIRWTARDRKPVLELVVTWETPTGEPAMWIGEVPLRNNPVESLAWLSQEPAIQRVLEEIPASHREILIHALQTMRFPSIQRTIRPVQ